MQTESQPADGNASLPQSNPPGISPADLCLVARQIMRDDGAALGPYVAAYYSAAYAELKSAEAFLAKPPLLEPGAQTHASAADEVFGRKEPKPEDIQPITSPSVWFTLADFDKTPRSPKLPFKNWASSRSARAALDGFVKRHWMDAATANRIKTTGFNAFEIDEVKDLLAKQRKSPPTVGQVVDLLLMGKEVGPDLIAKTVASSLPNLPRVRLLRLLNTAVKSKKLNRGPNSGYIRPM